MKQVQFTAFGVPHEVAACVEVPEVGPPGPDEVVIEVEAFPINPADLLTITGAYAVRPQLPATLGAECAGRIVAVGSGVRDLTVGDRVINLGRDNWCQQRKVPAAQALKVPADADVLQLAMLKVNPATALMMLRHYVALQPGDWVIQDAANSGVGTNLIRLAKTDGIRTVNVVRREALIEPLTAIGADAVVVDGGDLAARVQQTTVGAPLRLAIDAIGGAMVLRLADCLAEGGTVVNYGLLSGQPCQLSGHQTIFKGITLTGFWLQRALTSMPRGDLQALYADLAGRAARGALRVEVEATYAIEEIKAALAHAEREGRSGKVLVTPNGPV
jgi:NADPH:quinone reductase-like Zn-dependent oxidoreductase